MFRLRANHARFGYGPWTRSVNYETSEPATATGGAASDGEHAITRDHHRDHQVERDRQYQSTDVAFTTAPTDQLNTGLRKFLLLTLYERFNRAPHSYMCAWPDIKMGSAHKQR